MSGLLATLRSLVCRGLIAIAVFSTVHAAAAESTAAAEDNLRQEIERHAQTLNLTIGLSALHLESGRVVELNGDQVFPLASTYKVPMAAFALHLVGAGTLTLDQLVTVNQSDLVVSSPITQLFPHPGIRLSLLNLLEATLIRSDNTATDVLLRTIGGGEAVTNWLVDQGIEDLRVDRGTADLILDYMGMSKPTDGTSMVAQYRSVSESFADMTDADWQARYQALLDDPRDQGTPRAMVELLRGIWQDAYLDAAHGETLREIMARCLTGGARLSGRLPAQQLPLAHKTGTIGGTVNDVGVMLLPDDGGTVIIAVFTRGSSTLDVAAGERAIAEVGRTVYDYFLFTSDGS